MTKLFFTAVAATLAMPMTASAETVYLIIKSRGSGESRVPALLSVPMSSAEDCEMEGAKIISSKRFDLSSASLDAFECVTGK